MDPHTERLLRGIAESRFARDGMYGQYQMLGCILIGLLLAGVGFNPTLIQISVRNGPWMNLF